MTNAHSSSYSSHEDHHVCVALVRENGLDVVLFDATGVPRTFRSKRPHPPSTKLCFSSHGDHDEWLTPCLDASGNHGTPEESCFCGIETPHLHAHIHDPKQCDVASTSQGNPSHSDHRIGWLASQTLFPSTEDASRIPITDSLPKQCNASTITGPERRLKSGSRRLQFSIHHEDHEDALVHNAETNQLHLEHDCVDCGRPDVHGTFQSLGQRRWNEVQLHFFAISHHPFSFMESWMDLFEPHSGDAIQAVDHLLPSSSPPASTTKARSQWHVQNICCASEIPLLRHALDAYVDQMEMSVNTTNKIVYVVHDPATLTAAEITAALAAAGFIASLRIDGAQTGAAFTVTSILQLEGAVTGNTKETVRMLLQQQIDTVDLFPLVSFQMNDDDEKGLISVTYNPFDVTAAGMAARCTNDWGIPVKVVQDGADPAVWKNQAAEESAQQKQHTYPAATVMMSGLLWVISMLSFIGGNWEHLEWVALFAIAFGLPTIALKAFRTLRQCRFDINCLMLFASLGAVALQDYTEAAAVVFLFALSEWLEIRATFRARNALAEIVNLRPEQAVVFHPTTQELMVMPATAVPVGALVSVKTGDKIPCDGVVIEGTSTVDESSLTGESRPIRKGPNDAVAGGTINCGFSPLTIRTTATSENSAVARLIRLVEDAQANRSETEQLVDRFAQIYTPIVVLAGLLMCSIPWIFGTDTGREWTNNGLILIVIACPCSLIISTPVTYVAGLAATAQRGVLVKGGATLEALSAIRHICFDKTGTLTNAEFALLQLKLLSTEMTRVQVWQYLSLMEERASHPLALAILTAAKNEQTVVSKDMVLEDHVMINGEGVSGVINGSKVFVGNEKMFTRLQMLNHVSPGDLAEVEEWKAFGGTIGFMSVEGYGIVCAYCVADRVRNEATKVITSLRKRKIQLTMLTGDNSETANAVGKLVGLRPEEIQSKLLPEEKLNYVQELVQNKTTRSIFSNGCRSQPLVMMCGDGVNDAPALACANVGVAMGEGAALSMETSDVTLLDSNLEKIELAIDTGRRVTRKIIENVIFSILVKAIVLGFTLSGKAKLWAAIASDVGAMLIVTLNSMLLLPGRSKRRSVEQSALNDVEGGTETPVNSAKSCAVGCCSKDNTEITKPSCCKKETSCCSNDKAEVAKVTCCKNDTCNEPKASCCSKEKADFAKTSCCQKDTYNETKSSCYKNESLDETKPSCCINEKATVTKSSCCEKDTCDKPKVKSCCNKDEAGVTKSSCCKKESLDETKSSCCSKDKAEVPKSSCCQKDTRGKPNVSSCCSQENSDVAKTSCCKKDTCDETKPSCCSREEADVTESSCGKKQTTDDT